MYIDHTADVIHFPSCSWSIVKGILLFCHIKKKTGGGRFS